MRVALVLLIASGLVCSASQAHFFGAWEPRPALQDFWKPITESWWFTRGTNPRLERHCQEYARHHSPELLVPEMVADLKAYPSEVHWFVYLFVMKHWEQRRVLDALQPFYRSKDPDVHHIASEFIADIE